MLSRKKKEKEKRKTDFLLGSTSQICRGYISSTTLLSEFPFPTALSLSMQLLLLFLFSLSKHLLLNRNGFVEQALS